MKDTDDKVFEAVSLLIQMGIVRFQNDVWEAIGIRKQAISNIRLGTQHFRISHISKLCLEYGFDANWLLCKGRSAKPFLRKPQTNLKHKLSKMT